MSVIVLARFCVFWTAVSIRKAPPPHKSYDKSVSRDCFVRNNAAVPVQTEIDIFQDIIIIIIISGVRC